MKLDKALLEKNIEAIAAYDLENNKVSGAVYCVMQQGEVAFKKCFGYTSPDKAEPMTEKSLFRLASMTKPITAVAMLILVDRGLVSLNDPVSVYLPAFADIAVTTLDENGKIVSVKKPQTLPTVADLLSHSSGIEDRYGYMTAAEKQAVDDTVRFLVNIGLEYEPESRQQYSGFGAFDIAVAIIEKVSSVDYLTFLNREVFAPCGMVDTTFTPTAEQWSRVVAMHNFVDGRNIADKTVDGCIFEDFPCTHYLGGAGLVSTLHDYTRFAQMLLNKGETPAGRLMKESTFALMHQPHLEFSLGEHWGLGVRVVTDKAYGVLPVGAFGWSGAYGSHFWVDPVNEVTAVFLKNSRVDGGAGNESARHFEKAVNDSYVK